MRKRKKKRSNTSSKHSTNPRETPVPITNEIKKEPTIPTQGTRKSSLAEWRNRLVVFLGTAGSAASIWAIWPYVADKAAKVSRVEVQFVLSPASNRQDWNGLFLIANRGPATAKHIACAFLIANSRMHVGIPQVVGTNDAGAITATNATTSTASISIKDLSPDTGASFEVPIQVPDSLAADVFDTWKSKMFEPEFPKKLFADVTCTGENVRIVDKSVVPMPSLSKSLAK